MTAHTPPASPRWRRRNDPRPPQASLGSGLLDGAGVDGQFPDPLGYLPLSVRGSISGPSGSGGPGPSAPLRTGTQECTQTQELAMRGFALGEGYNDDVVRK
jgi:hypothetical protein